MHKYVFINFLPGSAGNFLSRELQLTIKNSVCWTSENKIPPTSSHDKFKMLSYLKYNGKDWVDFEFQLAQNFDIATISENTLIIKSSHGSTVEATKNSIYLGIDDTFKLINITYDTKDQFRWIFLNGLYKDSNFDKDCFIAHITNKSDNSIFQFNVENFFSWEKFKESFSLILDYLKINNEDRDWTFTENLYHEWWETTLKVDQFSEFEKYLGLPCTT